MHAWTPKTEANGGLALLACLSPTQASSSRPQIAQIKLKDPLNFLKAIHLVFFVTTRSAFFPLSNGSPPNNISPRGPIPPPSSIPPPLAPLYTSCLYAVAAAKNGSGLPPSSLPPSLDRALDFGRGRGKESGRQNEVLGPNRRLPPRRTVWKRCCCRLRDTTTEGKEAAFCLFVYRLSVGRREEGGRGRLPSGAKRSFPPLI